MLVRLYLAVLLLSVAGCFPLWVTPTNPNPNVAISASSAKTLALALQNVPDEFQIPPTGGVREIGVTGWRTTITNGFHNGVAPFFAPQPKGGPADFSLEILRAELMFSPTAVSNGAVSAVEAHLTYRARLVDRAGQTMKISVGTAVAKSPIVTSLNASANSLLSENAASAVESMFEAVSKELFEDGALLTTIRADGNLRHL